MNYKHYDVHECDFCKKWNRQTTMTSLLGVVFCLLTDDPEIYSKAYHLATHDNSGDTSWALIYPSADAIRRDKERKKRRRNRPDVKARLQAYGAAYRKKQKEGKK